MNRRSHRSRRSISSCLSRTNGILGYAALGTVGGLHDYVGYAAVLGVLGELVVVGFRIFGYDVWWGVSPGVEREEGRKEWEVLRRGREEMEGGAYTRRARGRE